jgi:pyrroloquinoline-quinone synthase
MGAPETMPWSREEFEQKLRAKGKRYHIYHPYQVAMNSGGLTREQIRGWVYNRYYYQISIPIKDAAVLSNMPDRDHRRQWIKRIIDHDGTQGDEGGIEAWIALGQACGLQREDVTSLKHVLPGVRFAVDAYINFARRAPWQEAVCSSLTELFAPEIHKERLSNWPQHYPWIDQSGYAYFRKRLSEARRDVEHGLRVSLDYFTTRAQQQRGLEILQFKLDILWSMLDAMQIAYGIGPERQSAGTAMPDD